jgi:hypothetical protein
LCIINLKTETHEQIIYNKQTSKTIINSSY